jgi:hypothetical protein
MEPFDFWGRARTGRVLAGRWAKVWRCSFSHPTTLPAGARDRSST